MYLRLGLVVTILPFLSISGAVPERGNKYNNQLKQVFHHRGGSKEIEAQNSPASKVKLQNIELGSIVFYLQNEPMIEMRDQKQLQNFVEYTFFLPHTTVTADAKKMIETTKNSFNNDLYRMQVVSAGQGGILVTIVCKTPLVGMRYQLFESIKRDKGIVFSFYNNELLKTLHKEKPVLTTAQNRKERVVVDCGHGGYDFGAISPSGIQEKQVCLSVGTELAHLLRKEGFDVILTRNSDCTVALDSRTSLANAAKADLFVSIHANSAQKPTTRGIETFYLDNSLLYERFSTLSKQASFFVSSLDNLHTVQNELLANTVHTHLIKHMSHYRPDIIDRKVKKNVSQVLLGTTMPAILIELGFLTSSEEKLLNMPTYQHELARGILTGIMMYRNDIRS